jgi:hypothetical protein
VTGVNDSVEHVVTTRHGEWKVLELPIRFTILDDDSALICPSPLRHVATGFLVCALLGRTS